jgi:hypothetical protein
MTGAQAINVSNTIVFENATYVCSCTICNRLSFLIEC